MKTMQIITLIILLIITGVMTNRINKEYKIPVYKLFLLGFCCMLASGLLENI